MTEDAELQEYFALVKSVSEFDQRLLTVKSHGLVRPPRWAEVLPRVLSVARVF